MLTHTLPAFLPPMRRTGLALALLVASVGAHADAATTRSALGANDAISWAQLGEEGTEVASPSEVGSNLRLEATVASPNGALMRFDEGAGLGSYHGNFAAGDALLTTLFDSGPISIAFVSSPVARVGAQIQSMVLGGFVGQLAAYGAGGTLLESVTWAGSSTYGAGDNSAIFLGLTRAVADIERVEFSILSLADPQATDFSLAINQLDISVVGTVPEPGSFAMGLMGLALLAALDRRRASRR
jgi:hypothetical protein